MPVKFELTVCITSTALFDCRDSHRIWKQDGLEAYKQHQSESSMIPLKPGVGFRLVESLLALNRIHRQELVEVVLVSRNDSVSGERVRHSIAHYRLGITRMSFTCGTDVTKYLKAWNCDLFLTTEEEQVRTVLGVTNATKFKGIAAGLVCDITDETTELNTNSPYVQVQASTDTPDWPESQVRIAFDGDGVLFSDEAERIYRAQGLEAFRSNEHAKTHIALPEGPMHAFAFKLQRVRELLDQENKWRIRTFLVTARNGMASERAFNTLKEWGLEIDETHFLGGLDKTPFLIAIAPAIFFDDSSEHVDKAKRHVPSVHVVYGVSNMKSAI